MGALHYIALGVVTALLIRAGYRASRGKAEQRPTAQRAKLKEPASAIVEKLGTMGYFKYAEAADIPALKKAMAETFNEHGILSGTDDDSTLLPKDYRFYFCDGEDLFEVGGLVDALERVKHTFLKAGLQLEWSDETDNQAGDNWDHRIKLNGKKYIGFKGDMRPMDVWGVAAKNFALMLNDQLATQGSDERVYLISGGNEGQLVFLTNEQYTYIREVLPDVEYNPLAVEEWCKRNKINR